MQEMIFGFENHQTPFHSKGGTFWYTYKILGKCTLYIHQNLCIVPVHLLSSQSVHTSQTKRCLNFRPVASQVSYPYPCMAAWAQDHYIPPTLPYHPTSTKHSRNHVHATAQRALLPCKAKMAWPDCCPVLIEGLSLELS